MNDDKGSNRQFFKIMKFVNQENKKSNTYKIGAIFKDTKMRFKKRACE